jgi:hypothetical protein
MLGGSVAGIRTNLDKTLLCNGHIFSRTTESGQSGHLNDNDLQVPRP